MKEVSLHAHSKKHCYHSSKPAVPVVFSKHIKCLITLDKNTRVIKICSKKTPAAENRKLVNNFRMKALGLLVPLLRDNHNSRGRKKGFVPNAVLVW
jgi:hypothetical protein